MRISPDILGSITNCCSSMVRPELNCCTCYFECCWIALMSRRRDEQAPPWRAQCAGASGASLMSSMSRCRHEQAPPLWARRLLIEAPWWAERLQRCRLLIKVSRRLAHEGGACSWRHFCHILLQRDQFDWEGGMTLNDIPNAIGYTRHTWYSLLHLECRSISFSNCSLIRFFSTECGKRD